MNNDVSIVTGNYRDENVVLSVIIDKLKFSGATFKIVTYTGKKTKLINRSISKNVDTIYNILNRKEALKGISCIILMESECITGALFKQLLSSI
jgi:hypothetical protein